MSVAQCQQSMTHHEFQYWCAVHLFEQPLGDSWHQTANLMAMQSAKRVRPEKFIPRARRKKSPGELRSTLMQAARGAGLQLKYSAGNSNG